MFLGVHRAPDFLEPGREGLEKGQAAAPSNSHRRDLSQGLPEKWGKPEQEISDTKAPAEGLRTEL